MLFKVDWIGLDADDFDLLYVWTARHVALSALTNRLVIWRGMERNTETNLTPNEYRGLPKTVSILLTTTKALLYASKIGRL